MLATCSIRCQRQQRAVSNRPCSSKTRPKGFKAQQASTWAADNGQVPEAGVVRPPNLGGNSQSVAAAGCMHAIAMRLQVSRGSSVSTRTMKACSSAMHLRRNSCVAGSVTSPSVVRRLPYPLPSTSPQWP
jgi:hypothetical protein